MENEKNIQNERKNENIQNTKSNKLGNKVIAVGVLSVIVLGVGVGSGLLMNKNEKINNQNIQNAIETNAGRTEDIELKYDVDTTETENEIDTKGKYVYKYKTQDVYCVSNLEVIEQTESSIKFKIESVHGIDEDHVNIGELTGTAKKVGTNKYVYEENEDGNECKIAFKFTVHRMFQYVNVEESYSKDFNPYAGNGVSFAGEYEFIGATNKEDTIKEEDNTEKVETVVNSEYNTAVAEIKKCLKDEDWLKANVRIANSEKVIDDADLSDEKLDFIVCKGDKLPVVVVEVSSENARFRKIVLVAYSNGKVKAEMIDQCHIYHGEFAVDANKNVVSCGFMHMGYDSTTLEELKDGNITFLGMYGHYDGYEDGKYAGSYYIEDAANRTQDGYKDVSKEEYEKFKTSLNETQYKFVSIGTELNNKNVDLYVK